MPDPNAKHDARLATYAATATALSLLSDRHLGELLAAARRVGSGIGGSTAELDVEGVRVFVKKVPLTELEQRSEHVMSTANLFGLPAFYQYPLGSAGFGAWRELAAHVMTTNWATRVSRCCSAGGCFPGRPPRTQACRSSAESRKPWPTGTVRRPCVGASKPSANPQRASSCSLSTSRTASATGSAGKIRRLK